MLGLIYKDLVNFKTYAKSILAMCAVFLVTSIMNKSPMFFVSFMQMVSIIVTISTFGYDERVEWDHYAMSLPLKRSDMVKAKYAFAYGFVLIVATFGTIIMMVYSYMTFKDIWAEGYTLSVLVVASMAAFVLSLVIPLTFKYGSEKGRYAMMTFLIIPFTAVVIMDSLKISLTWLTDIVLLIAKYPFVLPVLCIVPVIISYLASNQIYNKKEF